MRLRHPWRRLNLRRTSLYHPGVREDKDGRSARSGLASINFIDPHPSHTPLHAHPSTSQHIPPPFPFPPMTSRYLLACAPSPSRIPCTLVAPCDVSMVSCADRRPVDQLLPALCAVGRVTGLYYRPQRVQGGRVVGARLLWLYHCIVTSSVYLMRVRGVIHRCALYSAVAFRLTVRLRVLVAAHPLRTGCARRAAC